MTSSRVKLQKDTNFRWLQLPNENPCLSQRQMAKNLGLSFVGINFFSNALIVKGLVKIQKFSQSQNKFGCAYLLTPSGMFEKTVLTGGFLKRRLEEYLILKAEIKALKLEIGTENGEKLLKT